MIKERVVQILEAKGIAKEAFFAKIGMSSANFRGKARETPLNSSAIENILTLIPDMNLYWLITGKGEMFGSGNESELMAISKVSLFKDMIWVKDRQLMELNQEVGRLRERNRQLEDIVEKKGLCEVRTDRPKLAVSDNKGMYGKNKLGKK